MKKLFLIFTILCTTSIFAQKFTILKTIHPYYNIIEWKGMGGMLMSKDPTGNSNQIYLTLIADTTKSVWDQRIAPLNGNYYYIASENARYVYFLRNLKPEYGKIYFEQLNSAGNVKATSVSLTSTIKNLGYDVNELELRNVVVTDKALVHQFRHFDKKAKVYTEIVTFITHHNMLSYGAVLGQIPEEDVKNGKSDLYSYAGFSGDEICFSNYASGAKNGKGWEVVVYTSKGKEEKRLFLKSDNLKMSPFETIGFGTNGANYLNNSGDSKNGLVYFINGNYYVTIVNNSGEKTALELYQYEDLKWKEVNNVILNSTGKKPIKVGIYALNEAMTYHLLGGDLDETVALFYNNNLPVTIPYYESVIYNPSRMIILDKKDFFAVTLPMGKLYFDPSQLKNVTDVEFEFVRE